MAKRFYDTGLPDQLWYQKLSPKCKALYLHLLCKCDVAGAFEINYPMFSAYVGDTITEEDLFTSFGNRVVPLVNQKDKGILVDFIYFQCGGELNHNVKVHQSIFRRLDELGMKIEDIQALCTHDLKCYVGEPKYKATVGVDFDNSENETAMTVVEQNVVKPARVKQAKINNADIVRMFDEFYKAYPRHDSKQVAMLKFAKVMNDCKTDQERSETLQKMLKAIDISKISDQWIKNDGQFIPMPSTWLNQRRWEDEGVIKSPTMTENKNERLANVFAKALTI